MSEQISWDFCNVAYLVTPKGLKTIRYMLVEDVPVTITVPSYDRSSMKRLHPDRTWSDKGNDIGRVIVTLRLSSVKYKNYFTLYHEIGHFKNKDYESFHDQTTMWRDRYINLDKGLVDPPELKADEYAVSKIGKELCISALKDMQIKNKNDVASFKKIVDKLPETARGKLNQFIDLADLSFKELELRINHINNL